MRIELTCPKCGGAVFAEDTVREVFCTYCGAKFPTRTAPGQADETLGYVRSAYQAGEFAEAARAAAELPEIPVLTAYAAASGVCGAYASYREKAAELYKTQGSKSGFVRLLTGRDHYGEDSLHTEFFSAVTEQAAALAGIGTELAGQTEYAGLCGDVAALILRYKTPERDPATYWSESAVEQAAAGLAPYVEDARLAEIYAAYIHNHKPHELLPNQVKLEKEMKAELERRGLKPAVRPGLSGRLRAMFGGKGADER